MVRQKSASRLKQEAELIAADAELSDADKCLQLAYTLSPKLGSITWRKIMAAKMMPGAYGWTVTKLISVANVDRKHYYRLMNKPQFNENFLQAQIQTKGQFVASIFQAFINKALFGDKDGCGNSTNQLAYLRDMGFLKQDKSGDVTVNVVVTQEEREKKLQEGLNRFAGVVSDN